MNALDPGWFPDPMGRHEYRWWTGSAWGEHVSDRGLTVIDPVARMREETAFTSRRSTSWESIHVVASLALSSSCPA